MEIENFLNSGIDCTINAFRFLEISWGIKKIVKRVHLIKTSE